MERLLHWAPGDHTAGEVDATRVAELVDQPGWVWLDVIEDDAARILEVLEPFPLDPLAVEDVLDVVQLPKLEDYGDHLFLILHGLVSADDRIRTGELDCFLGEGWLVTVHHVPLLGLQWVWEGAQRHAEFIEGGTDLLLARIAEATGRRYLPLIDQLETHVDELADLAIDGDVGVLGAVQQLRRDESTIRRVLRPQRDALQQIRTVPIAMLDEEARRRFSDAYDQHNRVIESLLTARTLLSDVLDTYRGAAAEQAANVSKVLTVYAAIMLPLSLIAGIFGMNFRDLPGQDSSWGFAAVLAIMVFIGLSSWLVFERVGFLTRRTMRMRSLGRNLTTVSRLPVRTAGLAVRTVGARVRSIRHPAAPHPGAPDRGSDEPPDDEVT